MQNLTEIGIRKMASFPYQKQFKATIVKSITEEQSNNTLYSQQVSTFLWAANVLWKLQLYLNFKDQT